jgi:hypothetical protein
MSDYWDLPTCPGCCGILNEDGTHWASGQRECRTVRSGERALAAASIETEETA